MSNRGRRRPVRGRGMVVDEPAEQQVPFVEIRQWEGGSMPDVISFLERRSRISLPNARQTGNVVSVQLQPKDVEPMKKWNGVRFAGSNLNIKVVYRAAPPGGSGGGKQPSQAVQILTTFLMQRFNEQAKLLNLAAMMSDPTLVQSQMLANPQTAVKMFQALMKLASDNFKPIESVSLESNQLPDAELAKLVADTFPQLKNLSLANNQIPEVSKLATLKNKLPVLRELVLQGNPLQQHPAYQSNVREVVNMFPRLQILDGVTVRREADLPRNALAIPIKPTFFEDEGVASMVPMFLSNFFGLWDTNRSGLLALYDAHSIFSMCFSGASPHIQTSRSAPPVYIQMSRNLEKVSGQQARHNKIYIGPQQVGDAFNRLPASKHDLGKAQAFAIDAWKISDVRTPGDTAVMMVVHGEFTETSGNRQRSFDRSLVVLPGPNGSFIVASDMLTIRNPGVLPTQQQQQSTITPQSHAQSTPPPQQQADVPPPMQVAPHVASQQVSAVITPNVVPMGINPQVGELMRQTNLKQDFAEMCLKQANFNLTLALQLFEQSRGQLGPEAFNL